MRAKGLWRSGTKLANEYSKFRNAIKTGKTVDIHGLNTMKMEAYVKAVEDTTKDVYGAIDEQKETIKEQVN